MSQISFANHLLSRMPTSAFDALRPSLQQIETAKGQAVFEPEIDIEFAYFLERGQASLLAVSPDREEIEVGIIGAEGAVGLTLSSPLRRSPLRSAIQVAGPAWRIASTDLVECVRGSPELREYLELFQHYLTVLASYAALSHGSYSVTERLARWILMSHDRAQGDELHFVHEFLALMLCVRRAGVTTALHVLEGEHAIRAKRGLICITNRAALEVFANGSYGAPEREYERLFGTAFAKPVMRQ